MAKARILLVEDSESQANTAMSYLEKYGYDVVLAKDGRSAIKEAVSGNIDIVLLDLVLPDMSGYEVCRWFKMNQSTRLVPVLMLTVMDSVEDKVTGFESGAEDYLPKPYNEVELNARIYALLRTKALQDELAKKNAELEGLLSKVETLAITDPLTGLYNRRYMTGFIEKEIKAAYRYNSPLACMMIDIDYFKQINDEFGHQTGDIVLKEIARLIKGNVREVDTVARWGGEEFVVLLPRLRKFEDASISASRILAAVSGHAYPAMPGRKVTVSIGISGLPDPAVKTSDEMLDASDQALYEAKNKGRNRIVLA